MTGVFNLQARHMPSRVLARFMDQRAHARPSGPVQAWGENATTTNRTLEELARALGAAGGSIAGPQVTETTAMKVTAVYGCVSLIAGAISTLPICIYERTESARREVSHDYHWMLNEQANDDMTTSVALEYLVSAKLLYGDGFGRWLRASPYSSRVIGWEPLHPSSTHPFRDSNGTLYYQATPMRGPDMGKSITLDAADIIHVPSLGFDGLRSPSPITFAAREAIGNALAAEEYTGRFFSQGANFDIALKTESTLNQEQIEQLRTSYMLKHGGGANSRIPLILTGGLGVEKLSITPADADLLSSRAFTVQEICRVFGVPPFMIGHTEKSTSWGSGIEQQGIGFVKYSLRRHLVPCTQEFNRKLWPVRARYFVEFDVSDLQRGDSKSRNEAYRTAIGGAGAPGWMTPNEVRHLENLPPVQGGDTLHTGAGTPKADPATKPAPEGDPAPSTGDNP